MVTPLPRLVIAAPGTGQGKTTCATGLMAALAGRGLQVSGHKVGPDYIDPGYHCLATGRPGRNLDPHLVGEEQIVPLLRHGAEHPLPADIAVIEGVMGLFDGKVGSDGFSSTAHVAALTQSPVLVVIDVARMSRTAAAIVAGLAAFDPGVQVAGVILNRIGSPRMVQEISAAMPVPVLGVLPDNAEIAAPSRHLGLVPIAERADSMAYVQALGEQVGTGLDLDAIMEIARKAPDLGAPTWTPAGALPAAVSAQTQVRPVIAMAGGRAFTFRYPETEELLRAAGCDVRYFDPTRDEQLPHGTSGLYLGGGFPEVYAGEIAANQTLLSQIRTGVEAGMPTVAECAGMLLLAEDLDGAPMAGVLPITAQMTERLTLRYPEMTAAADTLLTRVGERATAHEFHRTQVAGETEFDPAWVVSETGGDTRVGFASGTLHASYLHQHWAGNPQQARRFAEAVHNYRQNADSGLRMCRQGVGMSLSLPSQIAPPEARLAKQARARLAALATPAGALGRFGDLGVWISTCQGQVPPTLLENVRLVIFAGDHGVADYGVSAYPPSITQGMVRTFLDGRAGVSALARANGVHVRVLDLGVDSDFEDIAPQVREPLVAYKIRRGSGAIHMEDALTLEETQAALAAGAAIAEQEIADGAQLLLSGDMGIGNTTPATAMIAAGTDVPTSQITKIVGRGTGLDQAGMARKAVVIAGALSRAGQRVNDPFETLAALSSPDLAATTGYLLKAAESGVPVLLDGLMSVACAFTAERIAPGSAAWYAAGHRSTEPAQSLALDMLGLEPLLDLGLRLGEGSGGVVAVPILRGAVAVLRETALLSELGA